MNGALFFAAVLAYGLLMQPSAHVIATGQTTLLALSGAAALAWGFLRQSSALVLAGLFVLSFKPHIGILFYAVLVFFAPLRGHVIGAGLLVALSCLPGLIAPAEPGALDVFLSMVRNVSGYGTMYDFNGAASMTGLRHVLYLTLGVDVGNMISFGAGLAAAIALGLALNRGRQDPRDVFLKSFVGAVVLCLSLVALHTYDFVLAIALVPFLPVLPAASAMAVLIGLGLVFRAGNLDHALGLHLEDTLPFFLGTSLDVAAACGLLAGVVAGLREPWRTPFATPWLRAVRALAPPP